MKKEIFIAFQVSRTSIFEVNYYTLGSNKTPHFSTSASVFNRPKTDFNQCGQCQKEVLNKYPLLFNFFNKWDVLHLQDLNDTQYLNLVNDLDKLKTKYKHLESDRDISFERLKELSKLK